MQAVRMPRKPKAEAIKPPPDEVWEAHKDTLQELYFNSTLKELMAKMETGHSFVASKNQYERKFAYWGFRTNLNAEEWGYVFRKKHKRDELGKESQVALNDLLIPAERIKKQRQRYTLTDLERICHAAHDAPSPPGVTVATPPAELQNLFEKLTIRLDNIPSNLFGDFLSTQGLGNSPSKSASVHSLGSSASTIATFNEPNRIVGRFQVYNQDLDGYLTYMGIFRTTFQDKESLKRQLDDFTIGQTEGDIDRQVERLLAPDSSLEFLQYIACIGSNNGLGFKETRQALKWIGVQSNSLLKKMFALPFPTVQACFDNFLQLSVQHRNPSSFTLLSRSIPKSWLTGQRVTQILLGALELEVDDIARKILATGIDVNMSLYASWVRRGKPIALLGAVRSAEVAQLILDLGADVNKPSSNLYNDSNYAPIYHALTRGNVALAEVYLKHSADFDPKFVPNKTRSKTTLLGNAIERQDIATVRWLLAKGAYCQDEFQHFDYRHKRTELQQAVVLGDTEILSNLLADDASKELLRSGVYRAGPLIEAASRGSVEKVKMLINAGADVNAGADENAETTGGWPVDDIGSTPLLAAIKGGHENVLDCLLQSDNRIFLSPVDRDGRTALEIAVTSGHSGIVSKLLRAGAGSPLDTPIYELYECGRNWDVEKARSLIAGGVEAAHLLDAFPTGVPKNEARILARSIVSTFLEVCADPKVTGPKHGKSALCIAIEGGEWDLAQTLIRHGANLDISVLGRGPILQVLLTPWHDHYWHDHQDTPNNEANDVEQTLKMMEVMLSAGADPNGPVESNDWDANTVLELALCCGEDHASELARGLIDHGAIVDRDENVLSAAITAHCDIDVIIRLLDEGAAVNPPLNCYNPLQAAIRELKNDEWPSAVDVIKLLLERGADVDAPPTDHYSLYAPPFTALGVAAKIGNLDVVKILLQKGADVNAPPAGPYCYTALQAAAERGYVEVVRTLLNHGAQDQHPTQEGCKTALEYAAGDGQLEIVRLLLDSRAYVNDLGQSGSKALQGAITKGHLRIVFILLEKGADPNAALARLNGHDFTPLGYAVTCGKLDIVQLLLNSGAVPSENIIEIAEEHGYLAIAELLREDTRKGKHGDVYEEEEAGKATDQQITDDNDADLSFVPTVVLDLSETSRILEVEDHDTEANVDQDQEGWLFGLENHDWAAIEVLDTDEQGRPFGHEQ